MKTNDSAIKDNENYLDQLIQACIDGDKEIVLEYLPEVKDINAICEDRLNTTPLASAALSGRFEIVKILLDHGAKVDSPACFDLPPIFLVVEQGYEPYQQVYGHEDPDYQEELDENMEMLKLLVEYGKADINQVLDLKNHNQGKSLLDYCSTAHHSLAYHYFKKLGAKHALFTEYN